MALEWDETCLDVSVSDYDPDSIVQLQALCRGWLVRKKLKDLQTEFQQIVLELDGPATQVEWTDSALPHPVICKLSKKKSRKNQDQVLTRKLSNESKQSSVKKTDQVIESECPKCAVQKNTVENSRTESIERSAQSVTSSKPDSEKIQSNQEVQTESMQTNQQRLTSEATQKEEGYRQPTVADKQQLRRDSGGEDNRFQIQDSGDADSLTVPKNLRAENEKNERHRITDNSAEGGSTRGSFPVGSEAVTSSASVRSSTTNVVSFDGVAAVSGPGSESSGMRRVDSFYGDQTSVWDSSSSVVQEQETGAKRFQGKHSDHGTNAALVRDRAGSLETWDGVKEEKLQSLSTEDLLKQRQNVAMELLWVQQAIISRKKYLKLKMQMGGAA